LLGFFLKNQLCLTKASIFGNQGVPEAIPTFLLRREGLELIMTSPSSISPRRSTADRWTFLRDVLVFQAKMLLSNLRDLALMPVSLVAALIDITFKGEREGSLFYKVLKWGAHSEEVISVYSAIEAHETGGAPINPNYKVDAMIARLEGVLVRECEKGGTAATIKSAMDRAFDQLHHETSGPAERAREIVARATIKLRGEARE
jgi:hypothetical protein